MSTSEQDTGVTRRDPLADEPGTDDEQHSADRDRADQDYRSDQQPADGSVDPAADPLMAPAQHESGRTDDLARDDLARDDVHPDDLSRDAHRDELDREPRANGSAADELRSEAATDTGTAGTATGATGSGTSTVSADTASAGERESLVPPDRAAEFAARWNDVKGMFVDEPRQAVQQADALVGELLDDLERLFREQRQDIEQGLENDDTSTEDLRMALRRYRSFFDRLLSV